jgi:hypothetical protein
MSFLSRRLLLHYGAAGLAATAATVVAAARPSAADSTRSSQTPINSPGMTVRWNSATRRWDARPPQASFGVVFLSTNDPAANAPTDRHAQLGDVWRRHPDAGT